MFKASELKRVGKFSCCSCDVHNGNSVCDVNVREVTSTYILGKLPFIIIKLHGEIKFTL
jgi:hypothetical protein